MEIKFLKDDDNSFVNNPYDVKYIVDRPYLLNKFVKIKLLQFLPKFAIQVIKTRKVLNLPENGLPYQMLIELYSTWTQENLQSKSFQFKIEWEYGFYSPLVMIEEIVKSFKDFIPSNSYGELDESFLKAIHEIVIFNIVIMDIEIVEEREFINAPIYWYPKGYRDGVNPHINIAISNQIKKRDLMKFIEEKFDSEISPALNKLTPLHEEIPSEYELHLAELNSLNPRLTYDDIGESVKDKYHKKIITSDSVKTAISTFRLKLRKTYPKVSSNTGK